MTERVVTTNEVGSWMQDLGDHFSSIIEDRSGRQVRPPAVDENGVKWTYERIEDVTGIPTRTVGNMVRKSRSGSRDAARTGQPRSTNDLTRDVRRAARQEPEAVTAGILDAPEDTQEEIERQLREAREQREQERLEREEDDMRARGANPDYVEPFPHDLIAEASRIASRIDSVRRDVDRLFQRAESDQRPKLVGMIRPEVDKLAEHVEAGLATVPDYVPDNL